MNKNNNLDLAWKILAEADEEKAFNLFLSAGEDLSLTDIVRSEAYRGAGEVIYHCAPYFGKGDAGYSFFKKSIELDKDNLKSRESLCFLFFDPEGQVDTNEKEFLENILYLMNCDFSQILDRYDDEEIKTIKEELQKLIKYFLNQKLDKLSNN